MAGGGGGSKGDSSGSGQGHQQATPVQIAELRKLLTGLEATNANVRRYRWFTTDRVLHRFITARNGNVVVALKMLLEHLDWRISYGLDTILDEDLSAAGVSHEFYWSGFDREGRPCLVFRACEHRKSDSDGAGPTVEDKVRYYCQLLERGFRDFAPAHKFCLLLDCRGAGTNVMDRKLFKVATPIIENNFPETQHATYVLPCNGIITMAWKVISSFLDPGTADKIRLVKDFDDPALAKAFTPETLKAFVAVKPSMAPSQPYVPPDPLSQLAPPPKSAVSVRSSPAILASSAGLPSVTGVPAPRASDVGLVEDQEAEDDEGRRRLQQEYHYHQQQQLQQRLPPKHPPASTSALAAFNTVPGTTAGGIGGGDDDDDSSVLLPPPSPGGSTSYGGGGNAGPSPSPSGSSCQPFREQPGSETKPKLSPAGAAAAAAGRGAPPSPSGSNLGPNVAAPPSPTGDSVLAASVSGIPHGGGSGSVHEFDETLIMSIKSNASVPVVRRGGNGFLPSREETKPERGGAGVGGDDDSGWARGSRSHAEESSGGRVGGGVGVGVAGESPQHRMPGMVEFTERTGMVYKRRDTLRGRFAYRQRYALLRSPASGAGRAGHLPAKPPTLTLLKGHGKLETEKVIDLQGAEVTLGSVMVGELYTFVISFSEPLPAPRRAKTFRKLQRQEREEPAPAPAPAPPRRNTDDFVFTGVLDNADTGREAAADGGGVNGDGDGDRRQPFPSASSSAAGTRGGATVGQQHDVEGDGLGPRGGGGGGGAWVRNNSLPPPHNVHATSVSASTSALTSPFVRQPGDDNSSSSSVKAKIGGGVKRASSFRGSLGGSGARKPKKTLHLACDTEEQAFQWARWLKDAIALHEAAAEKASVLTAVVDKELDGVLGAPWRRMEKGQVDAVSEAQPLSARGVDGMVVVGSGDTVGNLEQRGSAVKEQPFRTSSEHAEGLGASTGEAGPPLGPGGGAPTAKRNRFTLDGYRRNKANLDNSHQGTSSPAVGTTPSRTRASLKHSLGDSLRRSSPSFLSGRNKNAPSAVESTTDETDATPVFTSSSSPSPPAAEAAPLSAEGEAGGDAMSMSARDSEISRLRSAHARLELSREEMKRSLQALAAQLREGENKAGAAQAEREAALFEVSAKEAELEKKDALLQEARARATTEAKQKEELVSSLQLENQALQAAVERLRHDFQEERSLRVKTSHDSAAATSSLFGTHKVPPIPPARSSGSLGILARPRRVSNSSPATPARGAWASGPVGAGGAGASPQLPAGSPGVVSSPRSHDHHARTGRRALRATTAAGLGLGVSGAATMTEWDSMHGGIRSRRGRGSMVSTVGGGGGSGGGNLRAGGRSARAGEGPPWVLNTDQVWVGAARPPQDVLAHLLAELDVIKSDGACPANSYEDDGVTVPPGDEVQECGAGEEEGVARKKEGFLVDTEAFREWSRRTGELQKLPPLESVDLPGEKDFSKFTKGCLELLREHAALILHKEADKLTAREEARMAYVIGNGTYTIARLSAHLGALVAGLPTE